MVAVPPATVKVADRFWVPLGVADVSMSLARVAAVFTCNVPLAMVKVPMLDVPVLVEALSTSCAITRVLISTTLDAPSMVKLPLP